MDWFFCESVGETQLITGENAAHISKSLRMSVGEVITLCDSVRTEHLCRIERISPEGVLVREVSKSECLHEPTVEVTLFAALTKGDKMESVIQKCVELGVHRIVPVLTSRCISRPDSKAAEKKLLRYRKISEQAAMQSQRAIVPEISPLCELRAAAEMLSGFDRAIVFYEGGGRPLREIIASGDRNIAVFTGPEGGYEESEVELLTSRGASAATLGRRILRAETAPLAALAAIMFHTGNLE